MQGSRRPGWRAGMAGAISAGAAALAVAAGASAHALLAPPPGRAGATGSLNASAGAGAPRASSLAPAVVAEPRGPAAMACPLLPASPAAAPRCWPFPGPALGAGQIAVRGTVVAPAACRAADCTADGELSTPEGLVRLQGAPAADLRPGQAVVVVGTWAIQSGDLSVAVAAVWAAYPPCVGPVPASGGPSAQGGTAGAGAREPVCAAA